MWNGEFSAINRTYLVLSDYSMLRGEEERAKGV